MCHIVDVFELSGSQMNAIEALSNDDQDIAKLPFDDASDKRENDLERRKYWKMSRMDACSSLPCVVTERNELLFGHPDRFENDTARRNGWAALVRLSSILHAEPT